jgi:hypothetical protein
MTFPETFFGMASTALAAHPDLKHEWSNGAMASRTLKIPKSDAEGFDVTIVCHSYGLYPYADDWHGAPWDVTTPQTSLNEMCRDCLGFVRSLLCEDSSLTVSYTNGRPYRWVLRYPMGGKAIDDRMGLLLFNPFGRRSIRVFRNKHLPVRERSSDAAQQGAEGFPQATPGGY